MNIEARLLTIHEKLKKWKPDNGNDLKIKVGIQRDLFILLCDLIHYEKKQ